MIRSGNRYKICKIVLITIVLSLITSMLSGCYFLPEEEEILAPPLKAPEEVTYKTYEVTKGTIERWINGTGYFVSTESATVSYTDTSGRLKDIYVKSGDTVQEGDIIAELDTGSLLESIEDQTIAVEKAEINLQIANESGDWNTIKLRKLDLKQAQLYLDRLTTQQEAAYLRAPMSGVLTYVLSADPGTYIDKYQNIAKIADPTKLQITFSHNNISDLKMGMEIDMTFNNVDNFILKGKVIQTPDNAPLDAPESDRKSVKIEVMDMPEDTIPNDAKYTVNLNGKEVQIELGDSVNIAVLLESKEDVIVLPMSYINRYATRRYVRVLKDGIPEERDIEVGIDNGSKVEIVGGIEEGELIII